MGNLFMLAKVQATEQHQEKAEINIGKVTQSRQYTLLTNRLYTPTVMERFAAK
jgi:hypothetical protein